MGATCREVELHKGRGEEEVDEDDGFLAMMDRRATTGIRMKRIPVSLKEALLMFKLTEGGVVGDEIEGDQFEQIRRRLF